VSRNAMGIDHGRLASMFCASFEYELTAAAVNAFGASPLRTLVRAASDVRRTVARQSRQVALSGSLRIIFAISQAKNSDAAILQGHAAVTCRPDAAHNALRFLEPWCRSPRACREASQLFQMCIQVLCVPY
jgi:hypothetical protein